MKSILIITGESYIGKGVESLLLHRSEMNVDSTPFLDRDSLNNKIENSRPNVVILDESLLNSERVDLFKLLSGYPKMRVLVLGINDNRISVYDHQEIMVSNTKDLVSAIEHS